MQQITYIIGTTKKPPELWRAIPAQITISGVEKPNGRMGIPHLHLDGGIPFSRRAHGRPELNGLWFTGATGAIDLAKAGGVIG